LESVTDEGLLFLVSEWETKVDYIVGGYVTQTEEWAAVAALADLLSITSYYGYEGQGADWADLVANDQYLEITIKEVTEVDDFNVNQEEFKAQYLDGQTLIQADFETAVFTGRGFRTSINAYEDLQSLISVGIAIEEDPTVAQAYWSTFTLEFKDVAVKYDN